MSKKEYQKQYYKDNCESLKEYAKKYRGNHREKAKATSKKWREEHPGYSKQQYRKNPEKARKLSRQYRKNNPEQVKESQRKNHLKKYNLSHEDWLKMWESQDGRCAICGEPFARQSDACVDHNHETGEIRGLLCMQCNVGLGSFNDNPKLIIKILKYLRKEEK